MSNYIYKGKTKAGEPVTIELVHSGDLESGHYFDAFDLGDNRKEVRYLLQKAAVNDDEYQKVRDLPWKQLLKFFKEWNTTDDGSEG